MAILQHKYNEEGPERPLVNKMGESVGSVKKT
jgi:hypothetical protein